MKTLNLLILTASIGMKPYRGWEVGYISFGLTPLDGADATKDPALNEPETIVEVEPIDEEAVTASISGMRQALTAKSLGLVGHAPKQLAASGPDPFAKFCCTHEGCTMDAGALQRARDPKEIAQWKSHMAQRRETVKSYKNRFTKVLTDARMETLNKLTAVKSLPGTITKAAAGDIVFDKEKFADALMASMRRQSALSLQAAGEQVFKELLLDDPWQVPPVEVLKFNKLRENKLKDVADDVFEQVKNEIEAGLQAGESIAKLSDRIKATFNGISSERAERIAMTETAAVYGQGRQVAMESAGVEYKQWLTSGNDNVRASHASANNQIVKIDEPFNVGGEQLMAPGDPNGSAANVINCHCVSIAVEVPEEGEEA